MEKIGYYPKRIPHKCDYPKYAEKGEVYRCECGKYWRCYIADKKPVEGNMPSMGPCMERVIKIGPKFFEWDYVGPFGIGLLLTILFVTLFVIVPAMSSPLQ